MEKLFMKFLEPSHWFTYNISCPRHRNRFWIWKALVNRLFHKELYRCQTRQVGPGPWMDWRSWRPQQCRLQVDIPSTKPTYPLLADTFESITIPFPVGYVIVPWRVHLPVVPHKAVAEVSRIGNYRRDWLLWVTDGRAKTLMDRTVQLCNWLTD